MSITIRRSAPDPRVPKPIVQWYVVPAVEHVALVAYCAGGPVAVIECEGVVRYRLDTVGGVTIGSYGNVGEAQQAFDEYWRRQPAVHGASRDDSARVGL